jgi:RimJ/RimL family protein N-acetyltransferase
MSRQEFSNQESGRRQAFELQPHLAGELLELRPLRPEDWESLFAVASDPLIWEQHPARDRYKEEVFKDFFREALESGGALVVIDRKTQKIIGSSRYFGFEPGKSEVEIGWTFLARSHWGGKYNGELKRLMLGHAFKFVESVVFLIGPANLRSQRAVEKIGGVRRERRKTDLQGKTVEHVVYQINKPAAPAPASNSS